jgi:hypothetical protein
MRRAFCLGFARTGTGTLQLALEELGFGPCLHQNDFAMRPAIEEFFLAATEQKEWDIAFERSGSGFVAAVYWRELAAAFPDAVLILTERSPDEWLDSFDDTIGEVFRQSKRLAPRGFLRSVVLPRMFGGKFDRISVRAAYETHNDAVRRALGERLVVLNHADLAEGWSPLCRALAVPEPLWPFPRMNRRVSLFR